MQPRLLPDWIATVAAYNPVDWAIVAGREAVSAGTDWATVAGYCGLLAAFAVVCLTLATRAFGAYQAQVCPLRPGACHDPQALGRERHQHTLGVLRPTAQHERA